MKVGAFLQPPVFPMKKARPASSYRAARRMAAKAIYRVTPQVPQALGLPLGVRPYRKRPWWKPGRDVQVIDAAQAKRARKNAQHRRDAATWPAGVTRPNAMELIAAQALLNTAKP